MTTITHSSLHLSLYITALMCVVISSERARHLKHGGFIMI